MNETQTPISEYRQGYLLGRDHASKNGVEWATSFYNHPSRAKAWYTMRSVGYRVGVATVWAESMEEWLKMEVSNG